MKVEDLRIGDLVYCTYWPEKRIVRVYELKRNFNDELMVVVMDEIPCTFPEKYIEPIPLTPEILEKNGFTKKKDGQWVIEKKRIVGCCGQTCSNTNPWVYVIWVDKGYMGIVNYCPDATITKAGSYVHELQQCIRLCGIDKEIML